MSSPVPGRTDVGSEVVRVLIVEGHPLVRWALTHLTADEPGLDCVGGAATAVEGFELASRHRPDVVTIDCHLSDGLGWTLADRLRAFDSSIGVIMFAAEPSDELMLRA